MASDLERAEAILRAIPAKRSGDPGWLRRNRRAEEAAVEEFHLDLQMLVQFIRRRRRRSDQVLEVRVAALMAALDSSD